MSNVAATHHSDDAAAANAAKVAQRTTIVLGKDVGQLRQSQCVHAGLVVQEFGYSAVVGLGAIAAIRLALWLMAPPAVGPTNGIRDRMQIMHSGPSRKLDGVARPPDAAGVCI